MLIPRVGTPVYGVKYDRRRGNKARNPGSTQVFHAASKGFDHFGPQITPRRPKNLPLRQIYAGLRLTGQQAEDLAVSANHHRGPDEEDTGAPVLPNGRQPDPQESIGRQFRALHGPLKYSESMPGGKDLKRKRRTAPE